MQAKSFEKYDRVAERVKAGEKLASACKAEQLSEVTYYKAKKIRNAKPKMYSKKAKVPKFIDMPLAQAPSSKIAIIVATPENLKDVLKGIV